jgi:hypothetical protein
MLAATIAGQTNVDMRLVSEGNVVEVSAQVNSENTENLVVKNKKSTKETVQEYFSDIPIMIDVARCESEFRQLDSNGSVLRGRVNSQDVGVMQINEKYHLETSKKLNLNIHTIEGNMAYARYLYNTQGTTPWKYSSPCWNKNREVALIN